MRSSASIGGAVAASAIDPEPPQLVGLPDVTASRSVFLVEAARRHHDGHRVEASGAQGRERVGRPRGASTPGAAGESGDSFTLRRASDSMRAGDRPASCDTPTSLSSSAFRIASRRKASAASTWSARTYGSRPIARADRVDPANRCGPALLSCVSPGLDQGIEHALHLLAVGVERERLAAQGLRERRRDVARRPGGRYCAMVAVNSARLVAARAHGSRRPGRGDLVSARAPPACRHRHRASGGGRQWRGCAARAAASSAGPPPP